MRRRMKDVAGVALIAALALHLGTRPAQADTIDGEWCLGASHFAIQGPSILTPGGNRVDGSYTRHAFAYVVPASEPGAGSQIDMLLLNEETVQLTHKGQASPPEIWRRCKPTS